MKKRTLFRIALAVYNDRTGEGKTVEEWANDHGVSHAFFYRVINGRETSQRLERAIDAFIAEEMDSLQSYLRQASLPMAA